MVRVTRTQVTNHLSCQGWRGLGKETFNVKTKKVLGKPG